jgi:RND family efflux transporter MFP subunit
MVQGLKMAQSKHTTTRLRFLVFLWLITAVLLNSCARSPAQVELTPTPYPTSVIPTKPTYTVQTGDVTRVLNFVGRLTPAVREEMFFKTGGRVAKVYFKERDAVKKGDLLAELDTGRGFDLQRAEIRLENARFNLELARLQLSPDSQEYSLLIALKENDVKMAQLDLDELNAGVADARIFSPIDGTILSLILTEGSSVDAFKVVVIVANLDELEVLAELSSDQLSQVAEGMTVEAKPIGRPGEALQGMISSLPYPYGKGGSNVGQASNIAVTTMQLNPVDSGYELGDLLQMTAVLEKKEGVLWLPPNAVRTFEGRKFVVVKGSEGQSRVDVKVGIESEDRVEIMEGLAAGQIVIAP